MSCGASVGYGAYNAHKANASTADRIALENSRGILMLNGVGMCLMSIRTKNARALMMPLALLTSGSCLFSGVIFYGKYSGDMQFHYLTKFGGSATIFGWLTIAFL